MELQPLNYGLTESRVEKLAAAPAVSPSSLPRAVNRSDSFVLLDGEWQFALDADDRGLSEGWHLGHEYGRTAHWPGTVEEHLAEAKEDAAQTSWQDTVVVWYEREFDLPPLADRTADKSIFQLTFGACGYETRVWLNGMPLQTVEGEAIHYGEYTSFSYELDAELLQPVNRLTVRIADSMDADVARGKQESLVYKRGGIWYQTSTGAVRSIWIEAVGRNRLRSRVGIVSTVEDEFVRVNVTTRIYDPGQYVIRLQVFAKDGDQTTPLAESDFPLRLETGQKQQRVTIEVPGAQLWSPGSPTLYRLVAQLIDTDGYGAPIETHFGLRKVEARGCCIYLNGKSVYLDGILYQPGTATFEEMKRHFVSMKELGCNLVRVHIAGIDPRIYNLADEMGLLLWVEVPSPHSSTEQSRANHQAELMRMLALMETHPSIVIWSLYNEDWGVQDIADNPETRRYITDMYHYMQIHHPQFLVVDNDGWRHVSSEGRLKSDLFTAHLYTPDPDRWRDMLDRLTRGELEGATAFPMVVGDPFFYRKQVPLVISEWGGFGFANYGGPSDADNRTERIRLFKDELRKRSIAGDVYTQATNIEDERNGLIDFHSGELMVPAGLLASRANR